MNAVHQVVAERVECLLIILLFAAYYIIVALLNENSYSALCCTPDLYPAWTQAGDSTVKKKKKSTLYLCYQGPLLGSGQYQRPATNRMTRELRGERRDRGQESEVFGRGIRTSAGERLLHVRTKAGGRMTED